MVNKNKISSFSSATEFEPAQIVCLEQNNTYLYSEVIQVIVKRQLCWVRPLMLFGDSEEIIDLRLGADLLLPISLFRLAMDTEVIPLIVRLDTNAFNHNGDYNRQQLDRFIRQIWQANRDIFQAS